MHIFELSDLRKWFPNRKVRLRLAHFWVLRCLTMFAWLYPFDNYIILFSHSTQHVFLRKFLCTFFIEISWIFFQSQFVNTKYLCLMMPMNPKLGGGGSSLSFVEKLGVASGISSQELCWWPFLKCQTEGTKLLKCFQEAARLQNDGRVGQGQHYNSATNFLVVKFGVL